MWAITNTTPLWIRARHLFPTLLQSLGFNIWCVWYVEFLPALLFFLTISLYTNAAHARHLPKSAANFKLKGKQHKKENSRNEQDLWILNLLKDTANVQTAVETLSYLQTWVHHRLLINHLRCSIYTQPFSVIGAVIRRHTPHDWKRKQRWANVSPAVLKTDLAAGCKWCAQRAGQR